MIATFISYFLILVFFIMERFIRVGTDARSLSKTKFDRNSTNVVALALIVSTVILIITPFLNNLFGRINIKYFGFLGIILMILGLIIRIIAAKTLGKFYMRTLRKTDNHKIVKNGIYKFIRHPGYLGLFLLFIGAGIAVENFISLILIFVIMTVAYSYRIKVEEEMLIKIFGNKYKKYMKETKRIIPFIN